MTKVWFTASELAALNLPGLPVGRTNLLRSIAAQKWNQRHDKTGAPLARKRVGRGGGFEYHLDLLPQSARAVLEPSQSPIKADLEPQFSPTWAWYEVQSAKIKQEAEKRLAAVNEFEQLAKNSTRSVAVRLAARRHELSVATLWNYLGLIEGCRRADRLPNLAPRRKGGGVKCEIPNEPWQIFKSLYLAPEGRCWSTCYDRTKELFPDLRLPHPKTFQRRLASEVSADVITLTRRGAKALRESVPAQKRTIAGMNAMDLVVVDGHKWDVFVRFPARHGHPERIQRPISVVIQDAYSRKILAWRTSMVEDTITTRLAFADLFKNHGIPNGALLDNGRAFASKAITGGAKTRFRFKINDNDPLGVLTQLGIKTHWATPGHGQAKPIERAFLDLRRAIAQHPICHGAYTGNSIENQPDNRGSRAVDLHVFEALVAQMIAVHNAKMGRKTEAANGGSFDEAFAESITSHPIAKATQEQLRIALLEAVEVRVDKKTAAIMVLENRYYADGLRNYIGQMITVRFDPDNSMLPVYAYDHEGRFVCECPIFDATGFLDKQAAFDHHKLIGDHRKKTREALKAQELLSAAELARMYEIAERETDNDAPPPKVRRLVNTKGHIASVAPSQKPQNHKDIISRFDAAIEARRSEKQTPVLRIFDGGLAPRIDAD